MANFYLKFNSEDDSIDFNNAVSIYDLGEILKSLFSAISAKKKDNIVLSQVTDNCYQVGFATTNKFLEKRVEDLGQEIIEKRDLELSPSKLKFKKAVAKPMKEKWYLEILNSDKQPVVTLPYGFEEKSIEYYFSNKSYEGFITEIGDKELNPSNLHIYISGEKNFKIFIEQDQHDELAKYYRRAKVRVKVRLKKSLTSERILSAKLISFKAKADKNFPYNIDEIDLSELNFIYE
ncbi:hypothetical protein [Gramella sp. MAR_2010_147]|uniref:hypothetical protein n=1 Tax=Gramella sp. MAR_2010_147 TaxID=1250205 RepID=UPI00087AB182|nr:hypothetical protein [Gramella sp. MAR_2010_147]SDS06120.1 hypothetical protein SAMN04488553_1376 [Gramella sp. MAR_2010_147]